MEPSWKQADVFPIIADIIRDVHREHGGYVTQDKIAACLLEDPEAKGLIAEAYEQQQEKQTPDWLAHNMVAWFSARITAEISEWADAFERTKISGHWAYTPKTDEPRPWPT